jgi:hypothetical protein
VAPGSGIRHPVNVINIGQLPRQRVLDDHIVRHFSRTRHEEPPRLRMPTPAFLVQMAMLLQQPPQTLTINQLRQVARQHMLRARDKQVNVVGVFMALEYLDLQLRLDRLSQREQEK